jgi:hypothetical protein
MKKLLLAAAGALLLAAPADGAPKGKDYKSPQEVFTAFQAAGKKNDWKTALTCLTAESQDTLVGGMAFTGVFVKGLMESFKNLDKTGKVAANLKVLDKVLDKHGINQKSLEKAGFKKEIKMDEKTATKFFKKLAGTVKDRPGFLRDFMAVTKKLSKNKEQEAFGGELKDVKVKDDTATGKIVAGKRTQPIAFKKVGPGWKIAMAAKMFLPQQKKP